MTRSKKNRIKRSKPSNSPVETSPPVAPVPQIEADAGFWRSLLLAVETKPIGSQFLPGASGLKHKVIDVGVDTGRNRIVVLTDSPDPKMAAFMQADLQQANPNHNIVTARTLLVHVAPTLKQIASEPFFASLSMATVQARFERLNKGNAKQLLERAFAALLGDPRLKNHSSLAFIHQLLTQIVALDWSKIEEMTDQSPLGPLLSSWSAADAGDLDNQLGICPLPVFNMSADEVENVKQATSLDTARELLSKHGVWEYFFPKTNELALGLIDRGVTTIEKVREGVLLAPQKGHPLGEQMPPRIEDVVDHLKGRGFVVEGELGFQTTVAGAETRALVKFKPKESLLVKLKNLMSLVSPLLKFFTKS
jgi:hypothetical protein